VKALTGIPVNYLITVNFRGFRQIVDRLGGAWIDVDRRYFNDRGGPSGYAKIDLRPGYQKLSGRRALDYVRYRHTDSDLYRVARQQQFVKAFKAQVQESFGPTALPKVVNAITNNVEVAQGGGSDVPGGTILSYALFAYSLPRGHVFQNKIEGLEGFAELTTGSENIERAVQTFTHPDVESSEKATAVALGEKLKRACRSARDHGHRAERERGRRLGDHGRLSASAACQVTHATERPARQRAPVDYFRTRCTTTPRHVCSRAGDERSNLFRRRWRRSRRRSPSSRTGRCSRSSWGRRSTAASRRRRSTRRRGGSARTSSPARARRGTSCAGSDGRSRSRSCSRA
jgi:hypothetical protein